MQITIHEINQQEVLRYLGYQGQTISPQLEQVFQQCLQTTIHAITPKAVIKRFPIMVRNQGIQVGNTSLILTGQDIQTHLENCNEIYLVCVTIGLEIDRLIKLKMMTVPEEGVILDSCATAAIEQAADQVEDLIAQECRQTDNGITWRFSPGYGDLPLSTQKELLTVMDTHRKIGLGVTEHCLMVPGKSVSAIIGVTNSIEQRSGHACDVCQNREQCAFRKRGTTC